MVPRQHAESSAGFASAGEFLIRPDRIIRRVTRVLVHIQPSQVNSRSLIAGAHTRPLDQVATAPCAPPESAGSAAGRSPHGHTHLT